MVACRRASLGRRRVLRPSKAVPGHEFDSTKKSNSTNFTTASAIGKCGARGQIDVKLTPSLLNF